jgi:hypothetical protein
VVPEGLSVGLGERGDRQGQPARVGAEKQIDPFSRQEPPDILLRAFCAALIVACDQPERDLPFPLDVIGPELDPLQGLASLQSKRAAERQRDAGNKIDRAGDVRHRFYRC